MEADARKSVLVMEEVFLIAMDIEDILLERLQCRVLIAAQADWRDHIPGGEHDLVIIDVGPRIDDARMLVEAAREAGAAILLLVTADEYTNGVPGLEGHAVIPKPFARDGLVEIVAALLAGR